MIGPLTPATRPWPAQIHEMIARRQADIADSLDQSPRPTVSVHAGEPTAIVTGGRVRTRVLRAGVHGPLARFVGNRRTVVAVVAPLLLALLAAVAAIPWLLSTLPDNNTTTQQPGPTSTSATSAAAPRNPYYRTSSPSPTPTVAGRYAEFPTYAPNSSTNHTRSFPPWMATRKV